MSQATEPGGPAEQSRMILLPIRLHENRTVEGINFVPSPWGAPLAMALRGKGEDGRPWLAIANETPVSWLRVATPVPKAELEILHLQRLATDHRCSTGGELYDAIDPVAPGEDPPDIYAYVAGKKVGWELTAFSNSSRRYAQALFFEVSKRLALQQRHRIGHLTGYHISMWFGAADDPAGLPFKANKQSSYDRLIDALVAHRPDPNQFIVKGSKPPMQLTGADPVRTPDDVNFMSIPLLGGAPASGLFAMTGVSVGLAFQSDHVASQEWANLRKVVKRKDKPANNRLLISAGAPDSIGRCFVAEEVLAHFMLDHPERISANHLSSVILHFWSTGQAFELLGSEPVELWPAVYQGFNPTAHPFALST
ncbi:hypothetical protein ABZU86_09790 [Streptomyces sp. NPDC005271]|uniref:hypothetical protein n=1 Tax=Streptomyces sp. NPDC005271 TaxID=3157030 RepID=UPI0033B09ABD